MIIATTCVKDGIVMHFKNQLCLIGSWLVLLKSVGCLISQGYELDPGYNKNLPPGETTDVSISLFINRVSAVDENKEEISLDVFLQVYWEDRRVRTVSGLEQVEVTWEERHDLWVPDLYIRQLREMRVLSLFEEMTSVRLYQNSTIRVSIGATVIIKCDMDFVLYPLDVQKCAVDFSSYKYTEKDMTFRWKMENPVSFPSDFGDGYRLPKYVVCFTTERDMQIIFYGEGNHSTARLLITMSRELRSYLLESYLPSTLFVIMSWGSFVVIPEIVPGRMVLLVTTLLSLVTMFDTVRNNSPNALELKCIEVWLISCTLFVFLALIEYFVVLFGIRYDKHWRHPRPQVGIPAASSNNYSQISITNMAQIPPMLTHRGQNGNRVDGLRSFGNSKVAPQPKDRPNLHREFNVRSAEEVTETPNVREERTSPVESTVVTPRTERPPTAPAPPKHKFRLVAEYAVLYCGSQRGMLDQVSLVLFPLSFALFATVYWISYITESRRRMAE